MKSSRPEDAGEALRKAMEAQDAKMDAASKGERALIAERLRLGLASAGHKLRKADLDAIARFASGHASFDQLAKRLQHLFFPSNQK